jgi:hypothetical protein
MVDNDLAVTFRPSFVHGSFVFIFLFCFVTVFLKELVNERELSGCRQGVRVMQALGQVCVPSCLFANGMPM